MSENDNPLSAAQPVSDGTPDVRSQEAGKAPACESTRDLAVEVAETYTCKHPPDDGSDDPCDGTDCMRCAALAALSAPCPLRAELAELRAEHENAGKRWAKTFIENDSLRAELAKTQAYAEFEESRIVKICEVIGAEDIELAAEKITRLRAKVEAVRAIADQARLGNRDLRGALEAIDRALNLQPVEATGITAYLRRQWEWSKRTFGPGKRTLGILDHIRKELREIESKPDDLSEWIDVAILAMDGYWRHGGTPETFMRDLQAKQDKNFARVWPAPTSEDVAVEHDRSAAAPIDDKSPLRRHARPFPPQPQNTAPTETSGAAGRAFPSKEKGNSNV